MKNVLRICKNDLSRVFSSVVAIVVVLGLCVVPCLYAWFNIFSNWDPYGTESTSRIKVAVASEDKGETILGLDICVGDQVISALKSNDQIGWVFFDDTEDALTEVRSGDCYAALVVPEDFTTGVLSILRGDPKNPELKYYENEKKNAIAPKITGKAQTSVQEQVNSVFLETIADSATKLISVAEANGISAASGLDKIISGVNSLADKLGFAISTIDCCTQLSDSSVSLMRATITLMGTTGNTLDSTKDYLNKIDNSADGANARYSDTAEAVTAAIKQTDAELSSMQTSMKSLFKDLNKYNEFVSADLASRIALVKSMQASYSEMATALNSAGFTTLANQVQKLCDRLGELCTKLERLKTANDDNLNEIKSAQNGVLNEISSVRSTLKTVQKAVNEDLTPAVNKTVDAVHTASDGLGKILSNSKTGLNSISKTLDGYINTVLSLKNGLGGARSAAQSAVTELNDVAEFLTAFKNSDQFKQVAETVDGNGDKIGSYLASPIQCETVREYDVTSNGSCTAPFYTVLAQWVGALLCAVMLKTQVGRSCPIEKPNVFERFFGRYALFFLVGMAQAIIVSLGDLWYVKVQCLYPFKFVLTAVVTGLCFSMINYALVFALDNIGMAVSVIVMVVQVAGSGGTYPVEVLPEIFRDLYKFMPFRYAMNAMRETIGGMYANVYWENILVLLGITLGSVILGIALYYPCLKLNKMISKSKNRSEIML